MKLGEIWKSRFPNLTWTHIYKSLSLQSSRTHPERIPNKWHNKNRDEKTI